MRDCDDLEAPVNKSDEEFKAKARGWIEDAKLCKLKHQIVRDCIEKFNLETEKGSKV